jgi:hypothetical protein
VFQMLRPADGVLGPLSRLVEIWQYDGAWITVRLGLLGALVALCLVLVRSARSPWSVPLAWTALTSVLLLVNASYYPQYYVQLALPLALLAGALANGGLMRALWRRMGSSGFAPWARGVLLGALVIVGLAAGGGARQARALRRLIDQKELTYSHVAAAIRERSLPAAEVLSFEPNYTFLSGRKPARVDADEYLVDSYGAMLYKNLGIAESSAAELWNSLMEGQRPQLQETFWRDPAQLYVLAASEHAGYVVIDGRARYQLHPQTLSDIEERSEAVYSFGVATLREMHR